MPFPSNFTIKEELSDHQKRYINYKREIDHLEQEIETQHSEINRSILNDDGIPVIENMDTFFKVARNPPQLQTNHLREILNLMYPHPSALKQIVFNCDSSSLTEVSLPKTEADIIAIITKAFPSIPVKVVYELLSLILTMNGLTFEGYSVQSLLFTFSRISILYRSPASKPGGRGAGGVSSSGDHQDRVYRQSTQINQLNKLTLPNRKFVNANNLKYFLINIRPTFFNEIELNERIKVIQLVHKI